MPRKPKMICLLFVALLLLTSTADRAAAAPDGARTASGPLWRLDKDGAVLYLLGSFHLLDNVDYRENPAFQRAFEKADVLVFETDLAGLESPATRQIIRSKGLYGSGKSLRTEISPQTYQMLLQAAGGLGLQMERLNTLRPWLCAITVTAHKYRQLGFLAENGVDNYFYRRARKAGKAVVNLETPAYQVSLFADMPKGIQEQMLAQTLEDLALFEEKVDLLVAAWESGDERALVRIMLENFREYPAVYERLVTDRNRRWRHQLEALMGDEQTVLAVVGVAHLVGPEGLLRLLQKRGYSVEQQQGGRTYPR